MAGGHSSLVLVSPVAHPSQRRKTKPCLEYPIINPDENDRQSLIHIGSNFQWRGGTWWGCHISTFFFLGGWQLPAQPCALPCPAGPPGFQFRLLPHPRSSLSIPTPPAAGTAAQPAELSLAPSGHLVGGSPLASCKTVCQPEASRANESKTLLLSAPAWTSLV